MLARAPVLQAVQLEVSGEGGALVARQYRIEHVDKKPQGWQVRSRLAGTHVLRIGVPPGARRRGAGRLLEVLHPKAEAQNPRCQMSEKAKANPEELIIFGLGNPDGKRRKPGEKGEPDEYIGACPHCGKAFTAAQIEAREFQKHMSQHRAERAAKEQNPIRMQVFHDPAIKKFTAAMYHPEFGNLYASGHTKKQAARALREVWRKARKTGSWRNPGWLDPKDKLWGHFSVPGSPVVDETEFRTAREARQYAKQLAKKTGQSVRYVGPKNKPYTVRNPRGKRAGNQSSVYAKAVSLGYPYLRGEGRTAKDGETWLSRVTKTSDGTGPALYVGWNQKKRKWVIEHERAGNPRPRTKRRNPVSETEQAVRLFEAFHGKDAKDIVEKHVSAAMRKDYTALGKLIAVITDDCGYGEREITQKWDGCPHIDFSDDHVTLASSPDGRQLYAIGGNQNLNGCLEKFEGVDPTKDFIDLGEVAALVYEARKIHDNFEPVQYVHKFGGKGLTAPAWMYDRLKKQIFFLGGEYHIDTTQKISPGIEG